MTDAATAAFATAAGAWWRAAWSLAWVAGIAMQLQQPALWPGEAYPLMLAAGLAMVLAGLRCRTAGASGALHFLGAVALGFAFAGWRADIRLDDALAPEWEGCDIELVGTIDEMPQVAEDGEHFAFVVESARALAMGARDLKHVASLDAAAGRPLAPAVASAVSTSSASRASPSTEARTDAEEAADTDDADAPVDAIPEPPRGATPRVPSRVWLAWSRNQRDDRAVAGSPAPLRAGQRWRVPVRLRLPHGAMNPDGFDSELWLFDQDLRATGVVHGNGVLLSSGWAPIENLRQWVRDRMLLSGAEGLSNPQAAGALAALAVGDQAAIDGPGWEVFRNAGVAHLMSISGLHITMLGWLGGRAVGALWRRSERAALRLATPVAMRWGGVAVAWLYALLAGWGVPAQRTVVMLAATAALRSAGLNWPATLVALAAMVPVTLVDPWALLQPGFWLSFAAVGLLMMSEPARVAKVVSMPGEGRVVSHEAVDVSDENAPHEANLPGGTKRLRGAVMTVVARAWALVTRAGAALAAMLRGGVRAQVVASVGLAPLTLVAFQQVSLVGLLSNLVAEPWVTLVVTPLALLGVAVPVLWQLAALALRPLLWFLAVLSRLPLASVHVASAPTWGLVAGVVGGALLMLPIPRRIRLLGVPMLLPLAAPFVARPPAGRFELVAADIGQGTAVLVRTQSHLLLFDTGPRFGDDNDAGRRMLLPLLQARGEPRIDAMMLSHADADHVGGAQSLIDRLPVLALRSSLDLRNPLRANAIPHTACLAGQAWAWDGVRFAVLHPLASDYRPGAKTNSISCVLRVVDAEGRSALLTGDVEAPQEAALVARAAQANRVRMRAGANVDSATVGTPMAASDLAVLRSDVLVVPHHGSHTSSTDAFLDAVRPRVAVIQVGYRSRYGHPAPEVVARYRAHGIPVVRTDHCGAWVWSNDEAHCTRAVRRRYWGWQGTSETLTPARIAVESATERAGSDVANPSPGTPRGAALAEKLKLAMNSSFDEMNAADQSVRAHYQDYARWLERQPADLMRDRRNEAELIFRRVGITFAVYGDKDAGEGTERLIPFDQIPRVIPSSEWREMEKGLRQRVIALNRFIHDVYHDQEIIKAGIVPADQVMNNAQFRKEMVGVNVPGDVYSHIAGIDIVRAGNADGSGSYYVLEDNLRVPSGVSYMLENRKMMMRLFPELFSMHSVAPVAHYPDLLLETLRSVGPGGSNDPTVVVLTPGMYNSAYFEHAFLAQQMGVELVEGQDLFVKDDYVFMRTTQGPKRVDVIYRRLDDDFLDPEVFRKDSTLGCAGLLRAYRAGNVTLSNAIGTGVADDKSIYPYVPKMIEFYLGEQPILNNVPTFQCRDPKELSHVLANLGDLVVKEVHGAGGYGMLVGPASTKAEIEAFRAQLVANPANYIAQPTLSLSTCPTYVESGVAPRHIDLRPFVLSGKTVQIVPGGLTRVALKEGSLVVNSSQGGGTKDTWVLEAPTNGNGRGHAQGEAAAASPGQSQGQTQTQSQSQSESA